MHELLGPWKNGNGLSNLDCYSFLFYPLFAEGLRRPCFSSDANRARVQCLTTASASGKGHPPSWAATSFFKA